MSTATNRIFPPEDDTYPLLISVKETARLLSVSPKHVYRLITDKGLPVIKLGRRTLISVVSLERWILDQEAGNLADNGDARDVEGEAWVLRVLNEAAAATEQERRARLKKTARESASVPLSDEGVATSKTSHTGMYI